MKSNDLGGMSDDELLSTLHALCLDARRTEARLLAYLVEVEERRLHLRWAYSSMYDFCLRRLSLSENETNLRLPAARMIREYPSLLARVASGELHLSNLLLLREHLTPENVDELAAACAGKSKREVQEMLVRRIPKPDVPDVLQRIPENASLPVSTPANDARPTPTLLEPLAPERYRLHVTIGLATHDKLERARDLLMHRNPKGDLEVVLDRALEALLAQLEKEILGKTSRSVQRRPPSDPTDIAQSVRRQVVERDGEQCTFVAPNGERCPSRAFLELDHVEARAQGGAGTAENVRVLCRAHNRLHAEDAFGKEYIERRIHLVQTRLTPPAEDLDRARRGLTNLGFREADARRAVQTVVGRHEEAVALPDLLREAIALLTS